MLLKVKYYITCLLACVFYLNADHVCAQGREPDLWWSGIAPRTVFHHPLWGYVALFEFNGLYSGQSLSDMKPVLPEANWDRIKALPNMAILSSGVWVVAGGTPPRETPGSIFRFTPGKTPELLTGADLDSSIILGGGIDFGVVCRSYEPDGFALSRLYSTNSGASWFYGEWPDSMESGSWGFVNRLPDLGFVALYERDTSWHRLELPSKRWLKTNQIPGSCRELTPLRNGSVVAVVETSRDVYTGVAVRPSGSQEWSFHRDVRIRNMKDSLRPIWRLRQEREPVFHVINDSLAAMAMDSGIIVFSDGRDVWSVKMDIPKQLRYVGKVRTSVSVAGETIYMSYTDGMSPSHVTYHVKSGKTKILSRLPPMQIANNMIIGYHSNSLRIYEPEEDLLRPILRARGAGDEPIFPSSFSSLVPHDGAIYTRNQNGEVLSVNIRDRSAQFVSWLPTDFPTTSRAQHEIGSQPCVSTPAGLMLIGSRGLRRMNGRVATNLRPDSASFVYATDDKMLLSGYRSLFMSVDSGVTWRSVPGPFDSASVKPAISSCIVNGQTMIVAFRGYDVETDGTPDGYVPGGLYRSIDGGSAWEALPLPVPARWVESLHRSESGDLWCWAIDQYLEWSGTSSKFRYNTGTLLRSGDDGKSWQVVHSELGSQKLKDLAPWSISSLGGRVVVNSDETVLLTDNGDTWKSFNDIPPGTPITGSVIDTAGQIWAATNAGIYILDATTRVNSDLLNNTSSMEPHVWPNPSDGSFTLRWTAHQQSTVPSAIDVVDNLGRSVMYSINQNSITLLNASAGIYYLRWRAGSSAGAIPVMVRK
jgi:hypothetical protein